MESDIPICSDFFASLDRSIWVDFNFKYSGDLNTDPFNTDFLKLGF